MVALHSYETSTVFAVSQLLTLLAFDPEDRGGSSVSYVGSVDCFLGLVTAFLRNVRVLYSLPVAGCFLGGVFFRNIKRIMPDYTALHLRNENRKFSKTAHGSFMF